jgi:hypothetical protein
MQIERNCWPCFLPMFEVGDVVHFRSPAVGKFKYHLCLGHDEHGGPRFAFLFINSESDYKGECVLEDGDIPGLPTSRTDQSVVSFTNIPRIGLKALEAYDAEVVGRITGDVAGVLLGYAKTTKALTKPEPNLVVAALNSLIG